MWPATETRIVTGTNVDFVKNVFVQLFVLSFFDFFIM